MSAALNPNALDKCGPLAERIDWLRMMTGWPVDVLRAGRGDYLLIASPRRESNFALFDYVRAEELR